MSTNFQTFWVHQTLRNVCVMGIAVCLASGFGCTKSEVQTDAPKSDASSKPAVSETNNAQQNLSTTDLDLLMEARLPTTDLEMGWIRLFDGQSLTGWEPTTDANWRVEDDTIVVDAGQQGFLATKSRFADFELQLEFKASEKTNSGVFLRSAPDVKSPATDCYELNIAPKDNPFPTGSLVERIKVESEKIGPIAPDEWHTLNAMVDRSHIQTWVDGKVAADYMDDKPRMNGKIMLQFREGPIAFRNIRIRPIGYNVVPAKNLDQWHPSDAKAFQYRLTDEGFIEIEGGRADLELLEQLEDFCIQLRVQTLTPGTNSGVFFRTIPGSAMDGYECQINNLFGTDRSQPKDHGTGGIFKRTAAKAVLSDDLEDTFITICADGPQISTWVQGVQVVDWKDERKPHENPRNGYREKAGTIQLQAHDPTCKILFKSLLLSPTEDTVTSTTNF